MPYVVSKVSLFTGRSKGVFLLWIICVFCVLCFSCLRVCSLLPCGQVTSWERADLSAIVGDVYCSFVTFPCCILGQVWYLFVSFPDLCRLSYSLNLTGERDNGDSKSSNIFLFDKRKQGRILIHSGVNTLEFVKRSSRLLCLINTFAVHII